MDRRVHTLHWEQLQELQSPEQQELQLQGVMVAEGLI